jgi:hypothetical protein
VVHCDRYAYLKFAVELEPCVVFCQLMQYQFVLGFGGLRVESDHAIEVKIVAYIKRLPTDIYLHLFAENCRSYGCGNTAIALELNSESVQFQLQCSIFGAL